MKTFWILFAAVCLTAGSGYAASGKGSTEPSDPISNEPSCREILQSYEGVIEDPASLIPGELLATLRALLASTAPCRERLQQITALLEAFWATDPWCLADEQTFTTWVSSAPYLALPAEATSVVTALSSSPTLACRERLSAVFSIVRHYAPSPFEDGRAPILGTIGAGTPEGIATQLSDTVRQSAKRRRASCAKRARGRRN